MEKDKIMNMPVSFSSTKDRAKAYSKYQFRFIGNSGRAIVPVLHRSGQGYRIIGTASYIIKPNIFITAAHLFEGTDIPKGSSFYILAENSADYPLEIIEIQKHATFDLAFLVLEECAEKLFDDMNPLAVMNLPPEINEIVAIFGYSHSIVNPSDAFDENGVKMQPMHILSKWELGGVLEIHKHGRGYVKGECFETSILAEGRDSGAPMFNSNGFLIGLLSRSFEFEDGLPNSTCVSILNLSEISINGSQFKNQWSKKSRAAICSLRKGDSSSE